MYRSVREDLMYFKYCLCASFLHSSSNALSSSERFVSFFNSGTMLLFGERNQLHFGCVLNPHSIGHFSVSSGGVTHVVFRTTVLLVRRFRNEFATAVLAPDHVVPLPFQVVTYEPVVVVVEATQVASFCLNLIHFETLLQ